MSELFRPRRRPLLRLVVVLAGGGTLSVAVCAVIWLRLNVVPPDCADPATRALLHRGLIELGLPAGVSLGPIETRAGGYLAFRFACEAELNGIDPRDLAPDAAVPRSVRYISRLDGNRRHAITLDIQPRLRLERLQ